MKKSISQKQVGHIRSLPPANKVGNEYRSREEIIGLIEKINQEIPQPALKRPTKSQQYAREALRTVQLVLTWVLGGNAYMDGQHQHQLLLQRINKLIQEAELAYND